MKSLIKFSQIVDTMNTWIGKFAAFAILLSILISAGNATVRYVFDNSNNAFLEVQWMLFSFAFLGCASWTMILNEHIRIDILNNRFKPKTRYWIDILGHSLVLIPFCILMIYTSAPSAYRSWAIGEGSFNAGGLPQWPAKIMIPVAFTLLLLQGISELIKRVGVLRGDIEEPYKNLGNHGACETLAEEMLEVKK